MPLVTSSPIATGFSPSPSKTIKALVVDDSVVMRRLITRILESESSLEVIGSARNGLDAIAKIEQLSPDVVTLDIEMPELDGLGALRIIRERFPKVRVVMCSSLTQRGAACTIEALLIGASDYVTKQHSGDMSSDAYEVLQQDLTAKIKQLFAASGPTRRAVGDAPLTVHGEANKSFAPQPFRSTSPFAAVKKLKSDILVIGVSTGGPAALAEIIPLIPADFPLPIAIVQHMPPMFTQMLADRLSKLSRIRVIEAKHGMALEPGVALLAPGDYHMRLVRKLAGVEVELNQAERECSCRPAVDVLFRSAAEVYGGAVTAVVLTGMGQDGLLGVRRLKEKGAFVVVQDSATSVVWGMPGAIAEASLADSVLPLMDIIPSIMRSL